MNLCAVFCFLQEVRGHMDPALQWYFFVGQGPRALPGGGGCRAAGWGQPALQCLAPLPKRGLGGRIATASVRTDLAMTWVLHGVRCLSGGTPPYGGVARSAVWRDDVGIGPYGGVTSSAVGRATARAAPTPHLSALHFSSSRLFDIVNDDFRPPCGRFGHPANF